MYLCHASGQLSSQASSPASEAVQVASRRSAFQPAFEAAQPPLLSATWNPTPSRAWPLFPLLTEPDSDLTVSLEPLSDESEKLRVATGKAFEIGTGLGADLATHSERARLSRTVQRFRRRPWIPALRYDISRLQAGIVCAPGPALQDQLRVGIEAARSS